MGDEDGIYCIQNSSILVGVMKKSQFDTMIDNMIGIMLSGEYRQIGKRHRVGVGSSQWTRKNRY